ncbi:ABC transporter permease [Pseudonocardia sichuanensis]|uniref:Putative spermidine/putrescine transport system permease protein n=1 Tax=Pseudonocardia kunmingensis TaxID=630975 RepID=A0A543DNF3_9PSEU|nr:ABC transporter permease [Pseudonocardia kunmingensis]TQM10838.1 putative spermidine/putrescine transport system permease protein [Pseudonocardia kunmingensis]
MVSVSPVDAAPAATVPAAARRRPRGRPLLLLALPAVVVLAVFFVVPAARLAWLSVSEPALGFGNYTGMASDGVVVTVVLRTLGMAAVVTVLCVLCAYPYAYLMTIVGPRWRAVLTALVLLPFWTSLMARTFAWVVLLQDTGLVNGLLAAVGLGPARLLGTTAGVSVAMAQVMLPFMVLPVYSAMRGIDRRLVDAAMGLGATPFAAFLRVYLPLSLRGVAAGATLVMVLSLGFYVTPSLVGSPQQSMLAQLISVQVNQLVDFGAAGALAVTLLVVTLVLVAGVQRLTRTGGAPVGLVGGGGS